MSCSRIVFVLLTFLVSHYAQPEGWKMTDRFYGFRYQLVGSTDTVSLAVQFADDLGCFGWIQNVNDGVYVGEARCSKVNGEYFEEAVRSLHKGSPSEIAIKVTINIILSAAAVLSVY